MLIFAPTGEIFDEVMETFDVLKGHYSFDGQAVRMGDTSGC